MAHNIPLLQIKPQSFFFFSFQVNSIRKKPAHFIRMAANSRKKTELLWKLLCSKAALGLPVLFCTQLIDDLLPGNHSICRRVVQMLPRKKNWKKQQKRQALSWWKMIKGRELKRIKHTLIFSLGFSKYIKDFTLIETWMWQWFLHEIWKQAICC